MKEDTKKVLEKLDDLFTKFLAAAVVVAAGILYVLLFAYVVIIENQFGI